MAEFLEVMITATRMCKANISCKNCPLSGSAFCAKKPDELKREDFELAEEIIMKCAKEHPEHPIQTNEDKFEEIFGFEPSKSTCVFTHHCSECSNFKKCNIEVMWGKEEYKAPTEEVSE